jgi:D-amino peptidase
VKVFISVDIEGIAGIVNWQQCEPGKPQYDECRSLMAGEANAAILGAFDAGATEVLVADSHGNQRNLPTLDLDPRARIILGNTKPLSMMQGVDESFDAAFLIGYHAGAGHNGVLSHTYDGTVSAVRLNSVLGGEIPINAALAGYFGVPIALVTGDSAACREAESTIPGVVTVAVKEPITRFSADCLNPRTARERIRAAAHAALNKVSELEPYTLEPPIRFDLTFNHVGFADRACLMPGTTRVDPLTVTYQSHDFVTAYHGFLTMLVLAESVG